ncbi:MAG: hypothetical protein LBR39_02295 [Coriobacteriales bacterium]|jgi:ABC-type Fe3+ transport system permease subunit|nr:hypothetical protein [Coriobacteriales bacterium]
MAKKPKKSGRSTTATSQPTPPANRGQQVSPVRRAFTIVICVIVALGLMLPLSFLGISSCSTNQAEGQSIQQAE